MKRIYMLSIILSVTLVISHLTTAWAQMCKNDSINASTPSSRFFDNGDGTVTDTRTGLMWKKCAEGYSGNDCSGAANTFTWQDALKRAKSINTSPGFAGFSDWRLPNIKELSTIVEEQCTDPAVNTSVFPETPCGLFWTSSPFSNESTSSWGIDFSNGFGYWIEKTSSNYVRFVRGGQ